MTNTDLKPCPCCGEKAHLIEHLRFEVMAYKIACVSCSIGTSLHSKLQEAIDAWNKRHYERD